MWTSTPSPSTCLFSPTGPTPDPVWKQIRCKLYPACLPPYIPWIVATCSVNTIQPRMVEAKKQRAREATEATRGHARKSTIYGIYAVSTVNTICINFVPSPISPPRPASMVCRHATPPTGLVFHLAGSDDRLLFSRVLLVRCLGSAGGRRSPPSGGMFARDYQ
jgi:hypothetical protein